MKRIIAEIPNLITLGNLLCGSLAIIALFQGYWYLAALLIVLAAVLDFLDGFAARLLKVSGPFGKELDSLADMVSFGLAPGIMMYQMLISATAPLMWDQFNPDGTLALQQSDYPQWLPFLAMFIPLMSAYRLAKFNLDTRQTDSFIGLATPSNTLLILSILLCRAFVLDPAVLMGGGIDPLIFFWGTTIGSNPYILLAISFVFGILLVSEIPLFALKFKSFGWKGNEIRFVFLALSLLLLIIFQYGGAPFIIPLYIILSLLNNLFSHK
jgi:CDP-diacylglycerol--serine O-phosphatidyltransferase